MKQECEGRGWRARDVLGRQSEVLLSERGTRRRAVQCGATGQCRGASAAASLRTGAGATVFFAGSSVVSTELKLSFYFSSFGQLSDCELILSCAVPPEISLLGVDVF